MLVCTTVLYPVLCNSAYLYTTQFSTFCIFNLPVFECNTVSSFSICQNCTDLFVCNTLLQYKPDKTFLYLLICYICNTFSTFCIITTFSQSVDMQHYYPLFSIFQNFSRICLCAILFYQYKLIKLFSDFA